MKTDQTDHRPITPTELEALERKYARASYVVSTFMPFDYSEREDSAEAESLREVVP